MKYRHWHQFDLGCIQLLCIIKTAAKLFKKSTWKISGLVDGFRSASKHLAKQFMRLIELILAISTTNNNLMSQNAIPVL